MQHFSLVVIQILKWVKLLQFYYSWVFLRKIGPSTTHYQHLQVFKNTRECMVPGGESNPKALSTGGF